MGVCIIIMLFAQGYNTGYRYKALSLLEPENGRSGTWSTAQNVRLYCKVQL